jgi:hypothetical protein
MTKSSKTGFDKSQSVGAEKKGHKINLKGACEQLREPEPLAPLALNKTEVATPTAIRKDISFSDSNLIMPSQPAAVPVSNRPIRKTGSEEIVGEEVAPKPAKQTTETTPNVPAPPKQGLAPSLAELVAKPSSTGYQTLADKTGK